MIVVQDQPTRQDQPARDQAGSPARWRALLEARWRERLRELIDLSVAYHEADEQDVSDHAIRARLALAETDEALQRLTDGRFGQCEDCATEITGARLLAEPETRYCAYCAGIMPVAVPASSAFRGQECSQR